MNDEILMVFDEDGCCLGYFLPHEEKECASYCSDHDYTYIRTNDDVDFAYAAICGRIVPRK